MADMRMWHRGIITELLQIYKSHPCLWKVQCPDYRNRKMKDAAYYELVEYCKAKGIPEANRSFVRKKIQSLRGSFRKELRRVVKTGCKPSLWYSDLISFTKDQDLSDSNSNAESDQEIIVKEENETVNYVFLEEDREDDICSEESDYTPMEIPNKIQERTNSPTEMPYESTSHTETSKYKDLSEFDAVGINTAKKLAKMDPLMAIYAESLINNVLSKGLLKKLSDDTSLCDGCNKKDH